MKYPIDSINILIIKLVSEVIPMNTFIINNNTDDMDTPNIRENVNW